MPPQVGKPEGSRPITQTSSEGVQDVNSTQVEKQSPQKQKDAPAHEPTHARQATAKEAAHKRGDVAREGHYQQTKLNDQVIKGTKGNDNIHISKAPGLVGQLGMYEVNVNGSVKYVTKEQLEHTQINAGAGNDKVIVDEDVNVDVKVRGGSGNDYILGGSGNDRLYGGKGNDYIDGRGGKDKSIGGQGFDYVEFDSNDRGRSKKK